MNGTVRSRANLVRGLLLIAITVGLFALTFSREAGTGRRTIDYTARFGDVTGLKPGNPVRVLGEIRGFVRSMRVTDGRAEVTVAVDARTSVSQDATVFLRNKTFLGGRFLELDPGTPKHAPLKSGERLRTGPSPVSPDELGSLARRTLGSLPGLWNEGRELGSLVERLAPELGRFPDIAQRFRELGNRLDGLRSKRERRSGTPNDFSAVSAESLRRSTDELERLSRNFRRLSGEADADFSVPEATRDRLELLAGKLTDLSRVLEIISGRQERMLDNLERILGVLLSFDEALVRRIFQEEGMAASARGRALERIRELEKEAARP